MKRRQLLQAASAAIALPGLSMAQSYPTKSIRYIVPVAAGGGSDMVGARGHGALGKGPRPDLRRRQPAAAAA